MRITRGRRPAGPVLKEAIAVLQAAKVCGDLGSGGVAVNCAGPMRGMEVILIDDDGIFCVGMLVESVGKQDPCAEIHVAAPECAEFFAAEALELEPFCGGLLLRDHQSDLAAFLRWAG